MINTLTHTQIHLIRYIGAGIMITVLLSSRITFLKKKNNTRAFQVVTQPSITLVQANLIGGVLMIIVH